MVATVSSLSLFIVLCSGMTFAFKEHFENLTCPLPSLETTTRFPMCSTRAPPPYVVYLHHHSTVSPSGRELCALESTARVVSESRDASILVLAANPDDFGRRLAHLEPRLRSRITVQRLDLQEVTRNTALEGLTTSDLYSELTALENRAGNTCDGVRLAILHKYGGVYMDMDVILINGTRFLDILKRHELAVVAPKHGVRHLDSAFMKLPKKHAFLELAMEKIRSEPRSGGGVLSEVFSQQCRPVTDGQMSEMSGWEVMRAVSRPPSHWCHSVSVLSDHDLHPLHHSQAHSFLEPLDKMTAVWQMMQEQSLAVQYWNMMLMGTPPNPSWCIPHNSLLDKIFSTHCPTIREHHQVDLICRN